MASLEQQLWRIDPARIGASAKALEQGCTFWSDWPTGIYVGSGEWTTENAILTTHNNHFKAAAYVGDVQWICLSATCTTRYFDQSLRAAGMFSVTFDKALDGPILWLGDRALMAIAGPEASRLPGHVHHINVGLAGVESLPKLFAELALQCRSTNGAEFGSLDLCGSEIDDLSPVSRLPAIKSLWLGGCRQFSGLAPLCRLEQLEQLDLTQCYGVGDLSPLAGLKKLSRLTLRACPRLVTLEPLSGLSALRHLDLARCWSVPSVAPLRGLGQLQKLKLDECYLVDDLEPLSELPGLRELSIGGHDELPNLKPLWKLQALSKLQASSGGNRSCDGSSRLDTSELSGLRSLKTLELGHLALNSFAPVGELSALSELCLSCCSVPSLEPLVKLRLLRTLLLIGHEGATDFSPLSQLRDLEVLDLTAADIRDLSPLSSLAHLTKLVLRSCKNVTDLSPLAGLTALRELQIPHAYQCPDHPILSALPPALQDAVTRGWGL